MKNLIRMNLIHGKWPVLLGILYNVFQTDIDINFNSLNLCIWSFNEGKIIAKAIQQNLIVKFSNLELMIRYMIFILGQLNDTKMSKTLIFQDSKPMQFRMETF